MRNVAIYYEWYCIETSPAGRDRRRKLRWRMTQEDAVKWSAENPGKRLELVSGSGEERHAGGLEGSYVGWGQALPDESIEAAKEIGDRWTTKRRGI